MLSRLLSSTARLPTTPVHAVGIVAAAGSGLRLGADRPKALVPLAGRPLVCWAVDGAARRRGRPRSSSPSPPAERGRVRGRAARGVRLVDGGADPHRLGPRRPRRGRPRRRRRPGARRRPPAHPARRRRPRARRARPPAPRRSSRCSRSSTRRSWSTTTAWSPTPCRAAPLRRVQTPQGFDRADAGRRVRRAGRRRRADRRRRRGPRGRRSR